MTASADGARRAEYRAEQTRQEDDCQRAVLDQLHVIAEGEVVNAAKKRDKRGRTGHQHEIKGLTDQFHERVCGYGSECLHQ
jgi:hypothetical protein